jgi:hypothetical protein
MSLITSCDATPPITAPVLCSWAPLARSQCLRRSSPGDATSLPTMRAAASRKITSFASSSAAAASAATLASAARSTVIQCASELASPSAALSGRDVGELLGETAIGKVLQLRAVAAHFAHVLAADGGGVGGAKERLDVRVDGVGVAARLVGVERLEREKAARRRGEIGHVAGERQLAGALGAGDKGGDGGHDAPEDGGRVRRVAASGDERQRARLVGRGAVENGAHVGRNAVGRECGVRVLKRLGKILLLRRFGEIAHRLLERASCRRRSSGARRRARRATRRRTGSSTQIQGTVRVLLRVHGVERRGGARSCEQLGERLGDAQVVRRRCRSWSRRRCARARRRAR